MEKMSARMARNISLVFVYSLIGLVAINYFHKEEEPNIKLESLKIKYVLKDMVNLYNFRKKSGIHMNDLKKSLERFHSKPKVKKRRKVQGGCA